MIFRKPEQKIEADTDKVIELIETRGHVFLEGEYRNRASTLVVYCPEHDNTSTTIFYNYKRSKTGLPCCGRKQVSDKLKGRTFSEETHFKMSQSALERPSRGGKPRGWRKTREYWDWKKKVMEIYDNKCAITGKSKDDVDLVIHHLYSADDHSDLAYEVENGIVLTEELHKDFHMQYGFGSNNISQFQDFLLSLLDFTKDESMPISSQANSEELEGSETRAYDPDRVMKLHERLEKIKLRFQNT